MLCWFALISSNDTVRHPLVSVHIPITSCCITTLKLSALTTAIMAFSLVASVVRNSRKTWLGRGCAVRRWLSWKRELLRHLNAGWHFSISCCPRTLLHGPSTWSRSGELTAWTTSHISLTDDWRLEASCVHISQHGGGSSIPFYALTLKVTWHIFHHTLLGRRVTKVHSISKAEGPDPTSMGGVEYQSATIFEKCNLPLYKQIPLILLFTKWTVLSFYRCSIF